MGGVPVLLALAVVGVDYGYQPDGDGGIDYIVQVAPEHWEQAREAGEITSVVDPSVRGRVSRIVIRIGEGELPQDMGPAPPEAANAAEVSPAHALAPMPPPAGDARQIVAHDDDFVPAPDLRIAAADPNPSLAARVMRPDPQSGQPQSNGFGMPSSSSGGGTSAQGEAARGSAATAAGEATRANDDPLSRLTGTSNPNSGFSGDGANSANGAAANTHTGRPQTPSTDPRPAAGTTAGSGASSAGAATRDEENWTSTPPPSTQYSPGTQYSPNSQATTGSSSSAGGSGPVTPSRGFGAQPTTAGANNANGYTGSSSAGSTAKNSGVNNRGYGAAGGSDAVANNGRGDSSSAGTNNGSRGYADGSSGGMNYGAAGGGYAASGSGYGATSTNGNSSSYDPQRDPRSLSQDSRVAGYDSAGRPLNAAGQIIQNPNAGPAGGFPYESANGRTGYPDQYGTSGRMDQRDYLARERERDWENARLAQAGGGVPQYGHDRGAVATAEPASPSDTEANRKAEQEIAAELAAARAALKASDQKDGKSASVVTQPVFNFLLLVSLVANAYLILTMSKLLQRYRNMVANMRTASTSAHASS